MKATKYFVYLDGDDRYDWFDEEVEAIVYAQENGNKNTKIYKVEGELSDDGFDFDYEESDKTPVEFSMELPEEEPVEVVDDNDFEQDFPDIPEVESSDDSEYDAMAKQYADDQLVDPYDSDEFDGHEDFDVKEALEKLEENESEVECKNCFDLFPKEECIKTEHGYLCKKCNQELHSHQGTNLDLIDNNPFDLDYDDPRLPEEKEEAEVKEEPVNADEMRKHEKGINEELKKKLNTEHDVFDYYYNNWLDCEVDYDELYSVFELGLNGKKFPANKLVKAYGWGSDYDYLDSMYDTGKDIHDRGLQAVVDEMSQDYALDNANDPNDQKELKTLEEYYDDPDYWCDKQGPIYLVSYKGKQAFYLQYPYAGDPYRGGRTANDKELLKDAKEVIADWLTPDEEVDEAQISIEGADPYDLDLDLEIYDCNYDYSIKTENLEEHINDRPADIESDQKLQGVDNAVVDCKKYTLVAHSEDEKPVDCKMEKPALEEPLAGEEVEAKLYEDKEEEAKYAPFYYIYDYGGWYLYSAYPNTDETNCVTVHHSNFFYEKKKYTGKIFNSLEEVIQDVLDNNELYLHLTDPDFMSYGGRRAGAVAAVKLNSKGNGYERYDMIFDRKGKKLVQVPVTESLQEAKEKTFKITYTTLVWKDPVEATITAKNKDEAIEKLEISIADYENNPEMLDDAGVDEDELDKIIKVEEVTNESLEEAKEDNFEEEEKKLLDHNYVEVNVPREYWNELSGHCNSFVYLEDEKNGQVHTYVSLKDLNLVDDLLAYHKAKTESLTEAKKDEEELPPDPEVVKLEVHQELNNLVADEIEAIDGYEEVKADIIDKPIEHKDEIIDTINHIEGEEKEHIDELVGVTTEIPFEGGHEEPAPAPVEEPAPVAEEEPVEEPVVEEPAVEEGLEENCAADTPFDSDVKVGDSILIINMEGEPDYCGRKGKVEHIDGIGQLHGTWGGCAVIPGVDKFDIITEECLKEDTEPEEEKEVFTPEEQEEWNCDEDGESLDGYDTYHHCGWCGDIDTEYDMKHELNFGWLCPQCVAALRSRGEKLTVIENLEEASSAETRAFKNGGKDLDDLVQGKAIARIKDPKARAAAVAAAKAGRPDAVKAFTGDRKEDQAAAAYEKKAQAMDKAMNKDADNIFPAYEKENGTADSVSTSEDKKQEKSLYQKINDLTKDKK